MKRRLLPALIAFAALLVPCKATAPAYGATVFSKATTAHVAREACRYYGVSDEWIVPAIIDIVYELPGKPAHESNGDTKAKNGDCWGIVQFLHNPHKHPHKCGWHANKKEKALAKSDGVKDWRLSGKASIYRIVRAYRDGGKANIRSHWRATLGR